MLTGSKAEIMVEGHGETKMFTSLVRKSELRVGAPRRKEPWANVVSTVTTP